MDTNEKLFKERADQDEWYARGVGLQHDAVKLVKQYKWMLPKDVKTFFTKVAIYMNWKHLYEEVTK